MGADRNDSEDAMPFAWFDWNWGLPYLEHGPTPEMAGQFEDAVDEHLSGRTDDGPWGWKAPHSYLFLPFLHRRFPEMRFIHVIRDGRDIALSSNQRQARRYGRLLNRPDESEPVRSAAWWSWANLRAAKLGEGLLGGGYLAVRFEELCKDPAAVTRRIAAFSGGADAALATEVTAPSSIGRWRDQDAAEMREVEATCEEALLRFGYD